MKHELIKIVIKVLIYALGLLAAYFGVSSLTSCTVDRQVDVYGQGRGIFLYTDTFTVNHGNVSTFQIK